MSRLEPSNEASAMQKEISAIAEQGGRATKVEQLIQQYCPDGVEYKKLGELCLKVCSGGTPSRGNSDYFTGDIPWLRTQEVDWKDIYDTEIKITEDAVKNSSAKLIPENCVIIAMYGATAGKVGINKIPLTTNQACCNLQINPQKALYKYVYYWVCNEYEKLKSLGQGSQNNINAQIIKEYPIPVPPLPVQEEIVRILDTLTELQAELQAELQKRLQQYDYYRDNLLSFEGRTDVEWKKLGEITTILRGKRLIKSQLSNDKPYAVYHGGLEPLGYYESANRTANTTMIINVGASAGTIGYSKEDFWSSDGCYCVEHSKLFDDRYIYYALQTKEQQLKSKVRVAGIPTLDKPVVEDLLVPIPPLTEQQRIVNILDRFDALTTDITAGLPAEIEARRKQYEYYRDKLLTFKKK